MHLRNEKIKGLDNKRLEDFWEWAFSDIIDPRSRQIFSEFIVADALGLTDAARTHWWGFTFWVNRKKIAVSSAAYINDWRRQRKQRLTFDVSLNKGIDAATDTSLTFRKRIPHLYVFCLFAEKDIHNAYILDLAQWEFYVMSDDEVDEAVGNRGKIGYTTVKRKGHRVELNEIKNYVI